MGSEGGGTGESGPAELAELIVPAMVVVDSVGGSSGSSPPIADRVLAGCCRARMERCCERGRGRNHKEMTCRQTRQVASSLWSGFCRGHIERFL